jgi:hypothetical protein
MAKRIVPLICVGLALGACGASTHASIVVCKGTSAGDQTCSGPLPSAGPGRELLNLLGHHIWCLAHRHQCSEAHGGTTARKLTQDINPVIHDMPPGEPVVVLRTRRGARERP